MASAFAVGMLSTLLLTSAQEHPEISDELIAQVNFSEANFLTNEQLADVLRSRASGPELDAAILINAEARLEALKISLLGLARGLAARHRPRDPHAGPPRRRPAREARTRR